jgi:hypothetical protein
MKTAALAKEDTERQEENTFGVTVFANVIAAARKGN